MGTVAEIATKLSKKPHESKYGIIKDLRVNKLKLIMHISLRLETQQPGGFN